MEPVQFSDLVWFAFGGLGLLTIGIWAAWRKRRTVLRAAPELALTGTPEAQFHRVELRMEAIEALQEALASRLDEGGTDSAVEKRLQALAGQVLGLVRDKDASLEVALAGLDQLRARMRTLEQLGDAAEARGILERLQERLGEIESAQARFEATLGSRLSVLEDARNPFAEDPEQLTQLYARKDATAEAVFARLAQMEARLAEAEHALVKEGADAAQFEAQAIAAQLIAGRTVAEETRRFADRIALLEASLPRLSHAQALMIQALERQAAPGVAPRLTAPGATDPAEAGRPVVGSGAEDAALWRLPRVISMHRG